VRGRRFLVGALSVGVGAMLVWLSGAVPALQGAAAGSALDGGPDGLSQLAKELRDGGHLATSVRIDQSDAGVGLSPTPWDQWHLAPQDGVLSVRSDVALQPAELAAAAAWLQAGGHLVVVADKPGDLAIADQLVGHAIPVKALRDGAFVGSSDRPVVPDGAARYQLDGAWAVAGGTPLLASAGLAWTGGDEPGQPSDLHTFAVAARFAVGAGSVLVLGDAYPLENVGRGELDNARLATRIEGELSAGGGAVFIDEGHRSGGVPVRVDLVLRGIGPTGRLALGAVLALGVATAAVPWPKGLLGQAQRSLQARRAARRPAPATDAVAAVASRHPEWDPSLLARLAAGRADDAGRR